MLLTEREEKNVILSFYKDIEKPSSSKEKLCVEISKMLEKQYLSDENTATLQAMLNKITKMVPSNENMQCNN